MSASEFHGPNGRMISHADTRNSPSYQAIVDDAAALIGVQFAWLTFMDEDAEWVRSSCGFSDDLLAVDSSATPRLFVPLDPLDAITKHLAGDENGDNSNSDEVELVRDATADNRLNSCRWVAGEPGIRFLACAPIFDGDGQRIGSLLVADREVRTLDDRGLRVLKRLAHSVQTFVQLQLADLHRQEIVAELKISEQKYRLLYEKSPVMHVNVSVDGGVIESCNERLVRRLGYDDKSQIVGRKIFELYHTDCLTDVRLAFESFVNHGKVSETELVLQTRAGDSVPVLLNVEAVRDDAGEVMFSSSTWVEITRLKKTQAVVREKLRQLESVDEELKEFVYIASHDLKQPLRGIINLAQWIRGDAQDKLSGEVLTNLDLMTGRVKRMQRLLDDLLMYSRAGRIRSTVELIQVDELMEAVVQQMPSPQDMEITFHGKTIQIDSERAALEQVLRNLIGNAIKHRDGETTRVEVRWRAISDEFLEFDVTDDGPGILPKYHQQIFRMFQTLRPRDEVEGSGIGLAIVRKLVQSQGGTVEVRSNEPRGSIFTFTWPTHVLE